MPTPTNTPANKPLNMDQPIAMVAGIAIQAAAGDKKKPSFEILAYTGGMLRVAYYYYPVVVDLQGITIPEKYPLLLQHQNDVEAVGGQVTTTVNDGKQITQKGDLYGEDEKVKGIIEKAKAGHEWKASIGVQPVVMERVQEGATVQVNGQQFNGPIYVARKSEMQETSIVAIAADEKSKVSIQAKKAANPSQQETQIMAGETTQGAQVAPANPTPETPTPAPVVQAAAAPVVSPEIQAMRDANAAEVTRIQAIHGHCGNDHADIAAQAIREGWSADRTELAVLRAARPAPGVFIAGGQTADRQDSLRILQASMRLHSSEPRAQVEAAYKPEVLDRADALRSTSIRGFIAACCQMEGIPVPAINATGPEWIRAAFSTTSFSGLLSDSANKIMMSAFSAVPSAARKIAKKLTAKDFKTHTGYRLDTNGQLTKVTATGQLANGTLADSAYPFAVDTYGEIIGITRQMLVNDDMNAFTEIPNRIGMKGANTIEVEFWTMVLALTTFFHADNSNVDTSTATVDSAGLDLATKLLEEMEDAEGTAIVVPPKYLVVPPALGGAARRMYKSENLIATGVGSSAKKDAGANIYQGLYEPVVVPHLKSAPAVWYLLADPAIAAAFGIAYLNGVEQPTVEEVELSGEYLGKAWRGYLDFGVCTIAPQGGVKMS